MGRELKRVPLDFSWPIDQIWKGFLNPYHGQKCRSCDGRGQNKETKKIYDDWYSFDKDEYIQINKNKRYNNTAWQYHLTEVEVAALVKEGRLREVMGVSCHFDAEQDKWYGWEDDKKIEIECPVFPTPEAVNDWAKNSSFGHDGVNQWICVKARAEHLGVYGNCEICDGEGILWASDEIKKLHEDWVDFQPPAGEGYQLWTTTNEGAPISPVFSTLESLCEYAQDNCSTFGYNKTSKEDWMKMLDDRLVVHQEGNMLFI